MMIMGELMKNGGGEEARVTARREGDVELGKQITKWRGEREREGEGTEEEGESERESKGRRVCEGRKR
jgi:hypothetical protein